MNDNYSITITKRPAQIITVDDIGKPPVCNLTIANAELDIDGVDELIKLLNKIKSILIEEGGKK